LMRYLSVYFGFIPFINRVFNDNKFLKKLKINNDCKVDFYFWPKGLTMNREPDILVRLISEEEYDFVIEAKYYSGPSNYNINDTETGVESGNQLSDQYIDLLHGDYYCNGNIIKLNSPIDNRFIIYLTAHSMKPADEIQQAIEQYRKSRYIRKININEHLLWCNWTTIYSYLKKLENIEFPYNLIINDILMLLARRGFDEFDGFNIFNWFEYKISFWKDNWFNLKYKDFKISESHYYGVTWFNMIFDIDLHNNTKFYKE
ncbi:MAG TPA: hypothetical protein PL180_05525, partial [Spirochaetota bacterium]|nr:hypothetical protein [Spirochaetota bacterium]